MQKRNGLLLIGLLASQAWGALPPTAESLRRLQAITASHEVYTKLGSVNWIESITQVKEGYLLKSEKCTLMVEVKTAFNHFPGKVGPLPLEVIVGELKCK